MIVKAVVGTAGSLNPKDGIGRRSQEMASPPTAIDWVALREA
jgi:hypothetical protein